MIDYIMDPTTDMHRDTAADLWFLPEDKVTKELRQAVKSNWVFPQFYGSWYKECAKNLWEECVEGKMKVNENLTLRAHLKKNKIRTLDDFTKHCQKSEDIFWNERFKIYNQWKKEINTEYRKTGVISTPFGFQFKGYMKENDATNYPIQSAAFHCLLWSLIRINRYFSEYDLDSRIIGQIHDSIVIDLCPAEEEEVISIINYIGTTLLRETFDWLVVPMVIEFEITEVDEPWSTKKDIALTEHHKIFAEKNIDKIKCKAVTEDLDVWRELCVE
jgi:DNA polymerase I-like protein with 3'-5' exonuclease and polymerase domains